MTTFLYGSGVELLSNNDPLILTTTDTNGGTSRDTNYTLSALRLNTHVLPAQTKAWDTTSETQSWFHFEHFHQVMTYNNTQRLLKIFVEGVELFRLRSTAALTHEVEYWNGSSFTSLGVLSSVVDVKMQIDIQFVKHVSTGAIRIFKDKSLLYEVTGIDTTDYFGETYCHFGRHGNANNTYVSQFLAANYNTLTAKVKQTAFTANGAVQEWGGAYTAIDEAVASYTDTITSDTADEITTYKSGARDLTGFEVRAVGVQVNALRGGEDSPNSLRGVARISGTNYFTDPILVGYGQSGILMTFEQNPSTAAQWNISAAGDANLELGFQSRDV